MNKTKAFTILELLVVVAIIAIIAIIAVPSFIGKIDNAKESRELAEIASVSKAASLFFIENGYYPTLQSDGNGNDLQPTLGNPMNLKFSGDERGDGLYPKYLEKLPQFSYWYLDYKGIV